MAAFARDWAIRHGLPPLRIDLRRVALRASDVTVPPFERKSRVPLVVEATGRAELIEIVAAIARVATGPISELPAVRVLVAFPTCPARVDESHGT